MMSCFGIIYMYLFLYLFIHLFKHLLIVPVFIHLYKHLFIKSCIYLYIYLRTYLFIPAFISLFILKEFSVLHTCMFAHMHTPHGARLETLLHRGNLSDVAHCASCWRRATLPKRLL